MPKRCYILEVINEIKNRVRKPPRHDADILIQEQAVYEVIPLSGSLPPPSCVAVGADVSDFTHRRFIQ